MTQETTYCGATNCNGKLEFDADNYYEIPQGEEIMEIECPDCHKINSITWHSSVYFDSYLKDKEEA